MNTATFAVKRPLHVFIDGGFFEARLRQAKQFKRSVKTVRDYAARHLAPGEVLKIWYYDAKPFEGYGRHPLSKREFHFQEEPGVAERLAFFEDMRRQEGINLRLGQVSWQQEDWQINRERMMDLLYGRISIADLRSEDVYPNLRQKGVDLLLGLDLAEVALSGEGDRVVVIAGDADFLPVLIFARRQGLRVVFDSMGQRPNDDFKRAVDEFKTFVAPKAPTGKGVETKPAKPKRGTRGKTAETEQGIEAAAEAAETENSLDDDLTLVDEAVGEPGAGQFKNTCDEPTPVAQPAAPQAAEGEDNVGNQAESGEQVAEDVVDGNRLDVPAQGSEVYANIHEAGYVPPLPRYPTRSPRGESILEDSAAVAMQMVPEPARFNSGAPRRSSGGSTGGSGNFAKRGSWRGDPGSMPEDIGNRVPGYERQPRSGENRGNARPSMPRRGGKPAASGGQPGQYGQGAQPGQYAQGAQAGQAGAGNAAGPGGAPRDRNFKKGQPRKPYGTQSGKPKRPPHAPPARDPSAPRLVLTLQSEMNQAPQAGAQAPAQAPAPEPRTSPKLELRSAVQEAAPQPVQPQPVQSGEPVQTPAAAPKAKASPEAKPPRAPRAPRTAKPALFLDKPASAGQEGAPAAAPAAAPAEPGAKPNKKGWREQAGFEGKARAPRRKPREAAPEGGEAPAAAPAPASGGESPSGGESS